MNSLQSDLSSEAHQAVSVPAGTLEMLIVSHLQRELDEPNLSELLAYMRASHDESGEIYEALVPAVCALLGVLDAAAGLMGLHVEESVLDPLVMRGDFLDLEGARAWALVGAWLRTVKESR